jgi:hypothetical protein
MKTMRKFNPHSNAPDRAVQAWLILVGCAMNRQTLTYDTLAKMMYRRSAAGVLNKILGHIAFYCKDEGLPLLTSIVVRKKRGAPGGGIPMALARIDSERERVYKTDWFNIYPPTAEELSAAHANHK